MAAAAASVAWLLAAAADSSWLLAATDAAVDLELQKKYQSKSSPSHPGHFPLTFGLRFAYVFVTFKKHGPKPAARAKKRQDKLKAATGAARGQEEDVSQLQSSSQSEETNNKEKAMQIITTQCASNSFSSWLTF